MKWLMSIQVWLAFLPCPVVIATSITSKIWACITIGTRASLPISCRYRNHKSLMAHSSTRSVTSRTLGHRRVLLLSLATRHLEANKGLMLSSLALEANKGLMASNMATRHLEASRGLITSNMATRRLQTSRDLITSNMATRRLQTSGDLITSNMATRRLQTSGDFTSIVGDRVKIPVIWVDLITSKVLRGSHNLIFPPRDLGTRINRFSQVLTRHPGFRNRALALNLALAHV